jgi:putative ABC transport system ATP-binding protein
MDNKFLILKDLTKTFNSGKTTEVKALKNINLSFKKGEFVVFSGESGSGKSTVLNIIGALDIPTSGEVILENEKFSTLSKSALTKKRKEDIGFVFQAYNLIEVLSAKDNIEYILKLQKKDSKLIEKRTKELAKKLNIENILHKYPNELSGGQQQRVAVARAVASKPKLILADEPTANLDSKNSNELMDMMERLNEEEGVTVIFSSHDKTVIDKAKRVILLKDGEVISDKTVS